MCLSVCHSLIPGLSRGSARVKLGVRQCPPVSSVIINDNDYDPPGSVSRGGGGGGGEVVSWSAPVELWDCAAATSQQDRLSWPGPARSGELNAGTERLVVRLRQ